MAAPPIVYSRRTISAKALKVLGATEDEVRVAGTKTLEYLAPSRAHPFCERACAALPQVRFERALVLSAPGSAPSPAGRVFVECPIEPEPETEAGAPSQDEAATKPVKVLGLAGEPPLEWLQRTSSAGVEYAVMRKASPAAHVARAA